MCRSNNLNWEPEHNFMLQFFLAGLLHTHCPSFPKTKIFLLHSVWTRGCHCGIATRCPVQIHVLGHFGALQILLDNKDNCRPLASPMVTETNLKVKQLITDLYNGDHIDDMTKKWLCQTPNPPRIPEFYTLTKIHKPSPVGRPIVSGCDGPTEKLSSFVDKLLQPIAQQQKSYLKDTTDFVNFIENTKVPVDVILVSMDVTSLYTNIPQEEGIDTVCRAYEIFYRNEPPIPTQLLKRALRLILQENSFQFNGKNYLQTHGTAMGTKMAVAFSNIFMNKVEMEILSQSLFKPLVWKRYIDDIFLLWAELFKAGLR